MSKNPATQFKKGDPRAAECGRKGKRKPLDVAWRTKLEEYLSEKDKSLLDELFGVMIAQANTGNIQAIKELLDRAYGKAKQSIEHSGEIAQPVLECTPEQKAFIESDK